MRTAYAHEAVLLLEAGADEREPGAAITTALCGSWKHSGPCPLATHHTATHRIGNELVVRVLFAVERQHEQTVRERIVTALANGRLTMPPDAPAGWRLVEHRAGELGADELEHAARLATQ